MKFIKSPLSGVYLVELEPHIDQRGYFARTFCHKEFAKIGFYKNIVQINHSLTIQKGTIRGMHYQLPPAAEAKIIRCVQGKVYDVAIDLRAKSATFKQWYGFELSKDNMKMVYIPEGCAHGFQALSDKAELIYHHSEFYSPEREQGLRFDDPILAIRWPLKPAAVSPRDQSYPFIGNEFKGIEI
ncbi:MAG: dTDP-4-dehydrorhamnose 3,5-epimerase [Syntrophaceae bacterium]|nr:dTDP-4-dehydrorhamnose 3,5-epimerase [Syntrophaceae bacterium]